MATGVSRSSSSVAESRSSVDSELPGVDDDNNNNNNTPIMPNYVRISDANAC